MTYFFTRRSDTTVDVERGTRRSGYHVTSPFAVSSRSGTPDEFKVLVETAHEMGMLVLIEAQRTWGRHWCVRVRACGVLDEQMLGGCWSCG